MYVYMCIKSKKSIYYMVVICVVLFLFTINNMVFANEEKILSDIDYEELSVLIKEDYDRVIKNDILDDTQFQIIKTLIGISETYRGNVEKNFVFLLSVVETVDKNVKNENKIKTYVHFVNNARKRYVISQFLSGHSANTLVLQRDFNMWFYKPGTRKPIRISPSQRLLGGASYADVSNTNYNEHYDPISIVFVTVGKGTAYKVMLRKKEKGLAYEKIAYYIEKKSKKPIKAEFFSRSGRLLKSMYYRDFGKIKNRNISREWIIVDGINKKAVTYIRIEDIFYETLNEDLYTPERIKDF